MWPRLTEGTDSSLLQVYTIYVTSHLFIEYFIVVEENATRLIPAIYYNCTDSPQFMLLMYEYSNRINLDSFSPLIIMSADCIV